MLEQICDFIHNYFIVDVIEGDFSIVNGSIEIDGLQRGQYFKIEGSVFNNGIYQYPVEDLTDEEFHGRIGAMAVPPSFIALCSEIKEWQSKYGETVASPFTSENFGGYGYTKATGATANGSASPFSWKNAFASRLNHWRKIS